MPYTVGELARLTGVTVRTLHHYDELGLCSPSGRSDAGYRLYAQEDVLRLRQVLFYRGLGFPLDEIARVLDDGDPVGALREQRAALIARRDAVAAQLAAVDAAIESLEKGRTMTDEEMQELFAHEAEAEARWGDTEAFQESKRRTRAYGKEQWAAIRGESEAVYRRFVGRMDRAPDDAEVQAAVDEHRAHISRWFYPCSRTLQKGLGELYVSDPRFTANLDKLAPGLAIFLRAAFRASPEDDLG